MSTRNRAVPFPSEGVSNAEFSHHSEYREEMREAHYSSSGTGRPPPHSAFIDETLAAQYKDIQELLADNRLFATTHVALREELAAAQLDLERADKSARELHEQKDSEMRELFEKSAKMESEIQAVNAMRSELMQVHTDINDLTAARQGLATQVQMMTRELDRVTSDLRRIPSIKLEIEGLRHDLGRARQSTDIQKKAYAQSREYAKMMESKLLSLTREREKLQADLSNAEKRAQEAALAGNPGVNYNASYGHYSGNLFHPPYVVPSTNSVLPASGGL